MGYRSEVILAVGPEVMPQFMVTMAKSPDARAMCFAEHDEMVKDYCDQKGAFLFRWDGIKWYSGMGDNVIDLIDKFVDDAGSDTWGFDENESSGSSEHFRFVKVGEESDDITCVGDGFWDIYPSTMINY